MADNKEQSIAIFRGKQIRKAIHNNEWWFSIIDVIDVLTDSINPRDYWFKMKIRVKDEDSAELSTFCRQLKLEAPDKKMRETDCANTEGLFRIIQSIPSPKAGGDIAGGARKKLEKRLGKSVVSKENYLGARESDKLKRIKGT